jgi:hypothetical protein
MIRIIRSNDTSTGKAGEVFDFDTGNQWDDASDACAFMWGRDFADYIVIKNGLIRHYASGELSYIEHDLATVCL